MALRVPAQQIAYIKMFLDVPDEKINGFLSALAKAGPKFNVYDLAEAVAGPVGLSDQLTLGIIQVVASLYLTRDQKQPTEDFVDEEVYPALRTAQTFSVEKSEAQWKKFRKFLIEALLLERTLGTTAKAGPVLTQHERIFSGARIMTDLRPIYHLDVSERPEAAVVVHMLRITQRDNHEHFVDQYFALDSNDLVLMKEIIDRALKKEKALKSIVRDSVTVLDPKLVF